ALSLAPPCPLLRTHCAHRALFCFPTRRSSDLNIAKKYNTTVEEILKVNPGINPYNLQVGQKICIPDEEPAVDCDGMYYVVRPGRSEEHTSELQSRFDLVCRLLLEKKKHTQCNK